MKPGTNGVGRLRLAGTRGARAAVLGVAGTAAAAAIVGLTVPAGASTLAPQHHATWGTEHFQLVTDSTSQTSTSNPVIAYGVFTAAGTDYQNTDNTDTFAFPGGKVYVTHTPAPGSGSPTFNSTTCMFSYSEKGTFKLTGGTGKYRHIAGHGTYALSVIGIGTRLANGQCNPSDTAPLAAQQEILQAVGQVRLR
jgi:hypothetical protein